MLERRSKSYREKYELIDLTKRYELKEAAALIGKTNPVKFDATIELSVRLGVDPKQAEQNIRNSVLLPAGSGRQVRVAVFADGEDATIAEEAGAELVGEVEVIKELEAGSFSFDVLITSPLEMPKLGKYARLLGPRGLMPNPKSGTVTTDIGRAVRESKAGKIEYRVDSGGNLHLPIGKTSFTPEKILQNVEAALTSIQSNRPATLKGTYMLSASLSTSMGPALKLAI
ncbi:50S ribosomal protein L1 [Patescibacteria group bacterium]|nr:50S ribosomal protein L1 [Patescibacteria group bacterium]